MRHYKRLRNTQTRRAKRYRRDFVRQKFLNPFEIVTASMVRFNEAIKSTSSMFKELGEILREAKERAEA